MLLCSIGFPEVPMFLQILGTRYSLLNADPKSVDRLEACCPTANSSVFTRPISVRRRIERASPLHRFI
ncbi:hypothetical protein PtA15_1A66 [Puccinia triticina]|uniref:Uncharacterized protein n=1 Tax=Puccinia triticina TaxID=208348 RepID=A0ABY7C8P5_9BASI|nr:uncharacterized protein PtA15_1A66 [Puccinia triticina]WAQ80728.1 hypothetical protein PtA15_1A66 [Puccinia triticina]